MTPNSIPCLFLLLLLLPAASALSSDGFLLLSFRYSILTDPLSLLSSWDFNHPTPCSWLGVSCDNSSRVSSLSLPNSRLQGPLSPDLGLLDHLISLNLSSNSLTGPLPDNFFRADSLLLLDLSDNLLSGDLPPLISQLHALQFLNLSFNGFSGNIPSQLAGFSNLSVISLRSNNFSGSIPAGLDRVRFLDLSSNLINGSLGPDFGGQRIQYLNLSSNRISGDIPAVFGREIPESSVLDFSFNNLSGAIPTTNLFLNQQTASFIGNPGLCGEPVNSPCPIPSIPDCFFGPNSSPAIAALPNNLDPNPADSAVGSPEERSSGLKPETIAVIVAGDLAGVAILAMVLFLVYRFRKNRGSDSRREKNRAKEHARIAGAWSSPSSMSSSDTKGMGKWACLRKNKNGHGDGSRSSSGSEDDYAEEASLGVSEGAQNAADSAREPRGKLVTLEGEAELEVETLLKASAYILGASGPSIVYKAVLEDGSAVVVRRIGEGTADRLKDFKSQVRVVAKVAAGHPNLVRIRGFYWASDEKLVIYEFVPNGSLANARYRKGTGSSPCHLAWEFRLKIAKGVARGLSYLHDKKHVHGNLKPTNVLLDLNLHPKISDFGLDRLDSPSAHKAGFSARHFGSSRSTCSRESFPDQFPSPSPSSIDPGSPYSPPESLRSLKPNAKWDVFAFGVLLLELLTGKVVGPDDLATWVAGLSTGDDVDKARVLRFADLAIRADLEGMEEAVLACLRLGCACASPTPQKRPCMKEVVQVLERLPVSSSASPYF